ncbi:MAG TPA: heavy metal-binding domain-containing protein [Ktedonobacterales bacterium]
MGGQTGKRGSGGRKPPADDEAAQTPSAEDATLEQWLPPGALQRLRRMRGDDGKRPFFTSDLSVNEFLLTKEAGFEPLGMVFGSSIYHVGWQPTWFYNSYNDQELSVLSQAKYDARELAMGRMEAEATALGADGVIGVRLTVGQYDWGPDLQEFIAVGTAVRARDPQAVNYRTAQGKPFTSDLSGQDFRTLLHAGYRPVGMVMGTCVFLAYQSGGQFLAEMGMARYSGMWAQWSPKNTELQHFTQTTYSTREVAMGRMQAEAADMDATGIVGTDIQITQHLSKPDAEFARELSDQNSQPSMVWRHFIADVFAVGTAIVPISADHQIPRLKLVLSLDDHLGVQGAPELRLGNQ